MRNILLFSLLAIALFSVSCNTIRSSETGVGNQGLLAIFCEPDDANVYVDDVLQGKAKQFDGRPAYLELTSGSHKIRLEAPGYQPYRTELYISEGKEELKVTLRKK
ncbi:MAG TPA: PEGA domain-containing protein [bacterium]|nr:PEGA domain-containing protein [bacterium]